MTETALVRRRLIVHPTSSVTDDDTASIQQIFGALTGDQERTEHICADVARSIEEGRTCLVLTQRTSHIEAIRERLVAAEHQAHVLTGRLGKKAIAAVHEASAAPRTGTGMAVVATGSYLGEGFDWPELDTLFLAFPIAFKGRVAQCVGRLLRAHGTKHDVELHDYVDEHVPVLARMHSKRLPAYKTLGFDKPMRLGIRLSAQDSPLRLVASQAGGRRFESDQLHHTSSELRTTKLSPADAFEVMAIASCAL